MDIQEQENPLNIKNIMLGIVDTDSTINYNKIYFTLINKKE